MAKLFIPGDQAPFGAKYKALSPRGIPSNVRRYPRSVIDVLRRRNPPWMATRELALGLCSPERGPKGWPVSPREFMVARIDDRDLLFFGKHAHHYVGDDPTDADAPRTIHSFGWHELAAWEHG